jgi:hypothetical protein
MGVFGVVVEMEVQCVPLEFLEAKFDIITFDELTSGNVFHNVMEPTSMQGLLCTPASIKQPYGQLIQFDQLLMLCQGVQLIAVVGI